MPSAEGHRPPPPPPPPSPPQAAAEEDEEGEQSRHRRRQAEAPEGRAGGEGAGAAGPRYSIPREARAAAAPPELVWGKIAGFPWWPGQILDPALASRKARRLRREGRLLVAYFGDRTFAWCGPSRLRPFLASYADLEGQSRSHVFLRAVREAVAEAAGRAERAMLCPCVPEELRGNVGDQRAENAAIRKGVAEFELDAALGPAAFDPVEFVEYVRAVAVCPKAELGGLDLALARSHLMAYRRSQGCASLCSFSESGGLVENGDDGGGGGIAGGKEGLKGASSSVTEQKEKLSEDLAGSSCLIPKDEEKLSDFISRKLGRRTTRIGSSRKRKVSSGATRKRKRSSEATESDKGYFGHGSDGGQDKKRKRATTRKISSAATESDKGYFEHGSDEGQGKKKRKRAATNPYDIGGSKRRMPEPVDGAAKKSPRTAPYQSFKVGEFIRRFATRLTNSSPASRTDNGTLREKETEDELSGGRKDEGEEELPANKPGSSVRLESVDGKICSGDEVAELPKDVKYSRRRKQGHGPDEIETPPKEIKYLGRPNHGRGSDEDQTASKESKYSGRPKVKQSSHEDLTLPPKEITYSRRRRPIESSDEEDSSSSRES